MSKLITKEKMYNEAMGLARTNKMIYSSYNLNNLDDKQVDKLVTDNYNLDFL